MTDNFELLVRGGTRIYLSKDQKILKELKQVIAEAKINNAHLVMERSTNSCICDTCGVVNQCNPENGYCFVCDTDNWGEHQVVTDDISITLKKEDGFYDFEAPLLALHKKCCEAIEGLIPRGVIIDCRLSDNTPTINTNAGTATISNLCRKNNVVYAVIGIDYELNINDLLLNDLVALYEFLYDFMSELKRDLNN